MLKKMLRSFFYSKTEFIQRNIQANSTKHTTHCAMYSLRICHCMQYSWPHSIHYIVYNMHCTVDALPKIPGILYRLLSPKYAYTRLLVCVLNRENSSTYQPRQTYHELIITTTHILVPTPHNHRPTTHNPNPIVQSQSLEQNLCTQLFGQLSSCEYICYIINRLGITMPLKYIHIYIYKLVYVHIYMCIDPLVY